MSNSLVPAELQTSPASAHLRERDERLESLKVLVGKLIHDFNNFLVPLLGYVALLKDELPADSGALVYANTLENTARKTEGFLDQIQTAVRPYRSFHPKITDFRHLIQSVVVEWQNALPAGASLDVREELAPCNVTIDEAQWTRVLSQLLSNARFALATGGLLEIRLEAQTLSSAEMVDLNIAIPDVFRLVFRDHGFGMSPAVLRRACEPFFTTRGSSGAAGLGLTMTHSVAQQHGGQIMLESAEDMGTTVTIWIPTSLPLPRTSRTEEKRGAILNSLEGSARTKILLVEDDSLIREVLKPLLQRTGYEVFLASNGEDGLKTFRRFPRLWALIISDLELPKSNGWELYKTFQEEDPQARVILVSGNAQDSSLDQELGKLDAQRPLVIKKPFTLKSFNEVVRSRLGQEA